MADKKISQLTAATTPLDGTEVLPIVQSSSTVKVANNDLRPKQIQSNATSGVLQVVGPAAAATRVMTTPDANFTAARTDAGQTFTGNQRINGNIGVQTAAATTTSTDVSVDVGGSNGSNMTGFVNFSLAKGAIWDGANWKYTTSYADAKLFALTYSSGFLWGYAASGTAGNNVSFATLATLNNSGDFTPVGNLVQGTAAKGINFTANTPAAGKTSQLLNWYEEGTWTPVISDGTNNATMSGSNAGMYTRIGRQVTLTAVVETTSLGSVTGNLRITGLPYAAGSTNAHYSSCTVGYAELMNLTAGQSVGIAINKNNSYISLWLWDSAGGTTPLQDSEWSSDGVTQFQITYFV